MEVTLSQDCMEKLATLIAEKLSEAKVEKLVGIQDLSKAINAFGNLSIPIHYQLINNACINNPDTNIMSPVQLQSIVLFPDHFCIGSGCLFPT